MWYVLGIHLMVAPAVQEPGNKGTSRVFIMITSTNTCQYVICVKHYFEYITYDNTGNHHNSFKSCIVLIYPILI